MDDHSAYLADVLKESWSYPAKGNLHTVRKFIKELKGCPDPEKRHKADKTLWDKNMPGVPQELAHKGGERESLKAHYVMTVLWSIEGEMIDARDADYGWEWNISLHDIVSPASMRKVERSGQTMVRGRAIKGNVNHGYCPLCPYASSNHRTLNNHVLLHFCTSMACRIPDCWFMSHNAEHMWKHAAKHRLHTTEPVAVNPPKKK